MMSMCRHLVSCMGLYFGCVLLEQSMCCTHDWYVFVFRAQLGRVQVVGSGLQDGESGSSS